MKRFAAGRPRHKPGTMNKTEEKYAADLQVALLAGEIDWWEFEPFKLRLAPLTTYSPDFGVMKPDGVIELHEVKGHWEDDARVKIKIAADKFWMFKFVAMKVRPKRDGGGWVAEEF
jgi:hypothetical protein